MLSAVYTLRMSASNFDTFHAIYFIGLADYKRTSNTASNALTFYVKNSFKKQTYDFLLKLHQLFTQLEAELVFHLCELDYLFGIY